MGFMSGTTDKNLRAVKEVSQAAECRRGAVPTRSIRERPHEQPLREEWTFPKEGSSRQRSLQVCFSCHLPHPRALGDSMVLKLRVGRELERPGVGSYQAIEGPWLNAETCGVTREELGPSLLTLKTAAGWSQSPGKPHCDPSQADECKGV